MKHKVVIKKSRYVAVQEISVSIAGEQHFKDSAYGVDKIYKTKDVQPFVQHLLRNKLQCRGSVLGVVILAISEFCRS